VPRSKDFRAALSSRTADPRSDALSVYFPPADARPAEAGLPGTAVGQASRRASASPGRSAAGVRGQAVQPSARPTRMAPYVSITTYMATELEEALHRAAYARGGPSQKSVIVREALDTLLDELDALSDADPAAYADRVAQIRAEPRQGAVRAYLVDQAVHARLQDLAAEDRIPLSASVRAALRTALASQRLHGARP